MPSPHRRSALCLHAPGHVLPVAPQPNLELGGVLGLDHELAAVQRCRAPFSDYLFTRIGVS
eukprot:COSAG01_NODE_485_length_16397_cov_48.193827_22_plen_61_part_00